MPLLQFSAHTLPRPYPTPIFPFIQRIFNSSHTPSLSSYLYLSYLPQPIQTQAITQFQIVSQLSIQVGSPLLLLQFQFPLEFRLRWLGWVQIPIEPFAWE
jgi:hypothetical protein